MKKRCMAIVMCLVMMLGMIPATGLAAAKIVSGNTVYAELQALAKKNKTTVDSLAGKLKVKEGATVSDSWYNIQPSIKVGSKRYYLVAGTKPTRAGATTAQKIQTPGKKVKVAVDSLFVYYKNGSIQGSSTMDVGYCIGLSVIDHGWGKSSGANSSSYGSGGNASYGYGTSTVGSSSNAGTNYSTSTVSSGNYSASTASGSNYSTSTASGSSTPTEAISKWDSLYRDFYLKNIKKLSFSTTKRKVTFQWYYKTPTTSWKKLPSGKKDAVTITYKKAYKDMSVYCLITDNYGLSVKTNTMKIKWN